MQKHLYLISGLGADERIFNNLRFPAGYQVHYLHWIPPLPEEPISRYAARMAESITADGPVTLMGVSFGGIMSLEIARHIPVEKNILLSSIKRSSEKPPYYNWVKKLGLHKLPDQLLYQRRNVIVRKFLNIETPEERALVNEYLAKRDYTYMRWAVNAILHWENDHIPEGLVHIHGARDMPFPVKYLQPTHLIPDGGHFMVLNRSAVINRILEEVL
ncbi:alpha/beta fold hydrolase [Chitinophaga arvensicola]|uniref:Pimeloyl-ACP methyl ester carboxylesterase n=1 Tax=Chitinophaga arvensicola TaxID=29529 RepID=A0A1I0R577_9BACT|nr:alpha/beta hydrolase [Chitinophaga arvensicola]SEW35638.1 Pimeloyl-ACP methyl ester carboxylesterase [Chitinophaga arvensicola]